MATKTLSPDEVLEAISSWTVLDLANFNKAFSEKFGVTAAAPVAAVSVAAGGGQSAAPAEEAEQTEFAVVLTAAGDAKIAVIKAVREITGLGLKEAKDLVDAAPKPVKEGVSKEEAERVLKQLQEAGASGEVK